MTATVEAPPRRWIKWLLLVVVVLLAAMWVYAFVFAPRGGINPVKDKAWTAGAEAACAKADVALEPLVFRSAINEETKQTDLPRYVANLDQAQAVLDEMLDEIEALPRTTDKAKVVVPQWLADYRAWVDDLAAWTDKLRQGELAEFGVTRTDSGIPVDERINTFAAENRIESCNIGVIGG